MQENSQHLKRQKLADSLHCSGCSACVSACRVGALRMIDDEEGFERPVLDIGHCVSCGRCTRACPVVNRIPRAEVCRAFAVQACDEQIRLNSSSGGVFSLVASEVLSRQGVVFGAAWNDDCRTVCHRAVEGLAELHLLTGSKYMQSHIGNAYRDCGVCLKDGRDVLFTGTPCQIAGLRMYLASETIDAAKLICVQVVCHGVPSPAVWRAHLEERQNLSAAKISSVSFRDKSNGWRRYSIVYGNTQKVFYGDDWYFKAFLSELCSRPSCYNCAARGFHSGADLTVGDFWGIDTIQPGRWDDTGVSLVLVHSDVGTDVFDAIISKCRVCECTYEQALQGNLSLERNPSPHPRRDDFMLSVLTNRRTFSSSVAWCLRQTLLQKAKKTVESFFAKSKRVMRRLV